MTWKSERIISVSAIGVSMMYLKSYIAKNDVKMKQA